MASGSNTPIIYDSAQTGAPAIDELRELLRYRNLVTQMVRRDLVARYKRSTLGVAWTMLNPLGTMIILSVVFSQLMDTGPFFPVYLFSGTLTWLFFSVSTSEAMSNLIGGVTLLQRIHMPTTVFAVAAVGNAIVNLLVSIIPLLGVMLVIGLMPTPAMLFLPVSILLLACFSLGLGLLLSTLAVYFRDVVAMYQILLTAWMYLTPIIYPEELLSDSFRFWISVLNPMYSILRIFRVPVYEGRIPTLGEFLPAAAFSLVTLLIGWLVFTKKSNEFPYRI